MAAEGTDVAGAQQRVRTKSTLNRQIRRHCVRRFVVRIYAPGAADGRVTLRVGIAGQDAKLGDGIEVWNNSSLLPNTFLDIRPIDGKPVGVLALAVDGKLAGIRGPCHRNRPKTTTGRAVPCA